MATLRSGAGGGTMRAAQEGRTGPQLPVPSQVVPEMAWSRKKKEARVFCRQCGSEIPEGFKFCGSCGAAAGDAPAPAAQKPAAAETIYYQDGGVTISNVRAILGGRTYAMANITSVTMYTQKPPKGCAIAICAAGLLGSLGSLAFSLASRVGWMAAFAAVGATVALIGLILVSTRLKTSYMVSIGSASGEGNVLTSTDREYIERVVMYMNQAIVARG